MLEFQYLIPGSQIFMTIILTPLTFFISVTVGLLTVRVFMNMASGYTQIESWEEDRITSAKRRGLVPRNTVFPYDLGLYENVLNTMGPIYTWILPWGRPSAVSRAKALNVAVRFERNENGYDDNGDPLTWPPDMINIDPPQEILDQINDTQQLVDNSRPRISSSITDRQTALLQHQQQQALRNQSIYRNTNFELSNMDRSQNSRTTNSSGPSLPLWQRNRSDTDFYTREHWATFEGEKLSDLGVDLDSEMDWSNYAMNENNLNMSNRGNNNYNNIHNIYQHQHQHPQTHFSQRGFPAPVPASASSTATPSITTTAAEMPLNNTNSEMLGSTSSAALSRSASPLLRHSSSVSNSTTHLHTLSDGLPFNNNNENSTTSSTNKNNLRHNYHQSHQKSLSGSSLSDSLPTEPANNTIKTDNLINETAHAQNAESKDELKGKLEKKKEQPTLQNNGNKTAASSNDDDLPLAKILALRRQEKIKLSTS